LKARSTIMLVALAAVLAVAAAGCGSDEEGSDAAVQSDGGSLATSPLSKEEYVTRASAACMKRRRRLVPEISVYLEKKSGKELSSGNFAPVVKDVVVPAFEAEVEAVRALGAPEGDEEEIEAMLADQEAAIEAVRRMRNPRSFRDLEEPFADVSQRLEDYGFAACINGG